MKIAIIGLGNMGSWLARELSKDNEVAGYDTNVAKEKQVVAELGRVKLLNSLVDLESFAPQMLINAVSLQNTVEAFETVEQHLPKDCVLCDVASIKGEIPRYYEKSKRKFVSIHPMFGPTFATMDSLKEENAVIVKESTDREATAFFRKFFEQRGVKVFDYSFKEHDQMMAYSLTTPFAASLVFAACMEKNVVPGSTFARHRKIARGLLSEDNHLLSEILFNPYSLQQLEKITARLEFLKHVIKGKDYEEAKEFFDKLRKNVGSD